jgi:uncharacterized protein YgbK (DUF1537 family)
MTDVKPDGRTHWDGCWSEHHDCARVAVKRLTAENERLSERLAEVAAALCMPDDGSASLTEQIERLRERLAEAAWIIGRAGPHEDLDNAEAREWCRRHDAFSAAMQERQE